MSTQLILDATIPSPLLDAPLGASNSAWEFILARAAGFRMDGFTVLVSPASAGRLSAALGNLGLAARVLELEGAKLWQRFLAMDTHFAPDDILVFLKADMVLVNRELSQKMAEEHRKWRPEITIAEGYPDSLAPEVFTASLLPSLVQLAQAGGLAATISRPVYETVRPQINNYQVETVLSQKDHRLLRLDLRLDSPANDLLCRRLLDLAEKPVDEFEVALVARRAGFRTLPAYLNLQLVQGCPQVCRWCPHGQRLGSRVLEPGPHMDTERVLDLARQFEALNPLGTLGFSLWGEAALHPEIGLILDRVLAQTRLAVCVETSGIAWKFQDFQSLACRPEASRIKWIVSLDSLDPQVYRHVRGEGLETARNCALELGRLFPGNVWVQAVRTKENEAGLLAFLAWAKEMALNPIIQKYNHFSHRVPDIRVSDISPLEEMACWHLKRDINILLDGRMALCKEDLDGSLGPGNAFETSLEELWQTQDQAWQRWLEGKRPEICRQCDEYYTFNF